jgi:broad specificity phosphatase PhoE
MIELVLVRHGETEGCSSVRLNGATDVVLSHVGREQMRHVGRALAGETFERVLVSPLQRSREAAGLILAGRGPKPELVPAFTEIDFGRWETLTWDEIEARDPAAHAEWKRGQAGFRFPGGESKLEFRERVASAVTEQFREGQGRTLAVLHKGVIRVILGALLGLDLQASLQIAVHLGSIHRLIGPGPGWSYVMANQVDHLGPWWIPD